MVVSTQLHQNGHKLNPVQGIVVSPPGESAKKPVRVGGGGFWFAESDFRLGIWGRIFPPAQAQSGVFFKKLKKILLRIYFFQGFFVEKVIGWFFGNAVTPPH